MDSLLNIELIDLFHEYEDSSIVYDAYDRPPYVCTEKIPVVISELELLVFPLFNWFENNYMKTNPAN